jgi:SHS2 domain-containing protein
MGAGHRVVPRTTRYEAWAPSRGQCFAEAALALIESFADITRAPVTGQAQVWIRPTDDDDQLAGLLDEIIRLLRVESLLPVDLEISEPQDDGLDVRLALTALRDVRLTGPLPREIPLSGVSMRRAGGRWHASFALVV